MKLLDIDTNYLITATGFINSRHLDDKAGAAVLIAAMAAVVRSGVELPVDCHPLFTISEEVGSGASAALHQDVVEMLTIDNGTTAPGQNSSELGVTVAMADQSGTLDYHLTHRLIHLCKEFEIRHSGTSFATTARAAPPWRSSGWRSGRMPERAIRHATDDPRDRLHPLARCSPARLGTGPRYLVRDLAGARER